MLRHVLGGAVILISLQHFIATRFEGYWSACKPKLFRAAIKPETLRRVQRMMKRNFVELGGGVGGVSF